MVEHSLASRARPPVRAAALALMIGLASHAATAGEVNEVGGLAIKGYDPVAYFVEGKPVAGNATFTAEHKGATFRFVSSENRDKFKADPAAYAPQYGGFCAYGTAAGYKADIDPAAFTLVSGKLYLNYNKSVQAQWAKDIPGYVAKGDQNWPRVSQLTDVAR